MKATIHDPRLQGDRRFVINGRRVSAADHNVWVAECPDLEWEPHVTTSDELFLNVEVPKFVVFMPWAPAIGEKSIAFHKHFSAVHEYAKGTCLVASELHSSTKLVSRVLRVRSQLGDRKSGLWSIAAVTSLARLQSILGEGSEALESPTLMLAGIVADLHVGIAFDETMDVLMVRLTASTAPILERLTSEIRSQR